MQGVKGSRWTLAVGLAEQTAAIRRAALDRFIRWCDGNQITAPAELRRERLEEYQLHLARHLKANGETLALSTQATRLHPIRAFCRWLARERVVPADGSRELRMPRLPRRLPRWVPSIRQVERILALPVVLDQDIAPGASVVRRFVGPRVNDCLWLTEVFARQFWVSHEMDGRAGSRAEAPGA